MKHIDTYINEAFRLCDNTVIRKHNLTHLFKHDLTRQTYLDDKITLLVQLIVTGSFRLAFLIPFEFIKIHPDNKIDYTSINIKTNEKDKQTLKNITKIDIDNYLYTEINSLFQIYIPGDDASNFLDIIKQHKHFSPSALIHGKYNSMSEFIEYVFVKKHHDTVMCVYEDLDNEISDEAINKIKSYFK